MILGVVLGFKSKKKWYQTAAEILIFFSIDLPFIFDQFFTKNERMYEDIVCHC